MANRNFEAMSNPCSSDPRPRHRADYTESMQSDTLFGIRADLIKSPNRYFPQSWEFKRLRRINQVLRDRGFKNLTL
jgi:hypothetical protein